MTTDAVTTTTETGAYDLIDLKEVQIETSLSRSKIYALIAEGDFPKPVKLTAYKSMWIRPEVRDWVRRRIEARDRQAA